MTTKKSRYTPNPPKGGLVYAQCTGLDVYRIFEFPGSCARASTKQIHQRVGWCTRRVLDWTCTGFLYNFEFPCIHIPTSPNQPQRTPTSPN